MAEDLRAFWSSCWTGAERRRHRACAGRRPRASAVDGAAAPRARGRSSLRARFELLSLAADGETPLVARRLPRSRELSRRGLLLPSRGCRGAPRIVTRALHLTSPVAPWWAPTSATPACYARGPSRAPSSVAVMAPHVAQLAQPSSSSSSSTARSTPPRRLRRVPGACRPSGLPARNRDRDARRLLRRRLSRRVLPRDRAVPRDVRRRTRHAPVPPPVRRQGAPLGRIVAAARGKSRGAPRAARGAYTIATMIPFLMRRRAFCRTSRNATARRTWLAEVLLRVPNAAHGGDGEKVPSRDAEAVGGLVPAGRRRGSTAGAAARRCEATCRMLEACDDPDAHRTDRALKRSANIDDSLKHPTTAISLAAVAALRAVGACYFRRRGRRRRRRRRHARRPRRPVTPQPLGRAIRRSARRRGRRPVTRWMPAPDVELRAARG